MVANMCSTIVSFLSDVDLWEGSFIRSNTVSSKFHCFFRDRGNIVEVVLFRRPRFEDNGPHIFFFGRAVAKPICQYKRHSPITKRMGARRN